jgi:NAD(P)H-dependent flavin oxidoreductase YrpB (nitropropane dioxygenase family)
MVNSPEVAIAVSNAGAMGAIALTKSLRRESKM